MAQADDLLRIGRICEVRNGTPALSVVLSSGAHAVLKYRAESLDEAEIYEQETARSLTHCGMPTLMDKAIRCTGCALACPWPDLVELNAKESTARRSADTVPHYLQKQCA